MVFYKGGQVEPSKVHITISDPKESNEKMNVTVNVRPDLEASWNYRTKVLAKNLSDTALEDSLTELAVEGPRAPAFNTSISVAVLNPPPEVCRSARLKRQPIHNDDDYYQKFSYKHGESSQKLQTTTSSTVKGGR